MVLTGLYDSCAHRFRTIQLDESKRTAARSFRNAIESEKGNANSLFGTNPDDFDLYYFGDFDLDTGKIELADPYQIIMTGSYVKQDMKNVDSVEEDLDDVIW